MTRRQVLALRGHGTSRGDDPEEVARLEAGPADEGAVDVGAGEEFGGVVGLDAPAILDDDPLRRRLAELGGEVGADRGVHRLGLLRGGGQAGADRPDRLVGQDDPGHLLGGDVGERLVELLLDDRVGLVGLVFFQGLADADDREQLRRERGVELGVDRRLVSPRPCRRSEWPRMTWVQPASTSIPPEIDPVYAPSGLACMSWPPRPIGEPSRTLSIRSRKTPAGRGRPARRRAGRPRP